jgi:MGT family glycosyltransferase
MALAKAMQERGHEIVFFNVVDRQRTITERGLGFVPYGLEEYPAGSLAGIFEKIGRLKGVEAFQYFIERMLTQAKAVFRDLPELIARHNIEALVIDQLFPGGGTLAQHLRLPYASLANALAVNFERGVPPPTLSWDYEDSSAAEAKNHAGWNQIRQAFTAWREFDNAQRVLWGLEPYNDLLEDSFSPLAQIANQPSVFDFPRKSLPSTFHYGGPLLHPEGREPLAFPWEKLDGRPLIYASMGTLQNGLGWTFRTILEACAGLDAQLALSLGGSVLSSAELGEIPANAIVVPYAPQTQVLERAALCITHAGLNTALESLANGVPMVAIPVTNDQPGVAARIRYTQTGEVVPLDQLTAESLRAAVTKVLSNSSYRERAQTLQKAIAAERPLIHACEVIESDVLSQVAQPEGVEA